MSAFIFKIIKTKTPITQHMYVVSKGKMQLFLFNVKLLRKRNIHFKINWGIVPMQFSKKSRKFKKRTCCAYRVYRVYQLSCEINAEYFMQPNLIYCCPKDTHTTHWLCNCYSYRLQIKVFHLFRQISIKLTYTAVYNIKQLFRNSVHFCFMFQFFLSLEKWSFLKLCQTGDLVLILKFYKFFFSCC